MNIFKMQIINLRKLSSTTQLLKRPETFRFIFDNMVLSLREKLRITCTGLKSHHLKLPKSGYIVIVIKDNMVRSSWKLGNIQYLRTGLHEEINELTFSFLILNYMITARVITFLYPLDCKKKEHNITSVEPNVTDGHSIDNNIRKAHFKLEREYLIV